MKSHTTLIVLSVALLLAAPALANLSCLTDSGTPIAWAASYTYPTGIHSAGSNSDGNPFLYWYAGQSGSTFKKSTYPIDSSGTWFTRTIAQANSAANLQIIAFNDDVPAAEKARMSKRSLGTLLYSRFQDQVQKAEKTGENLRMKEYQSYLTKMLASSSELNSESDSQSPKKGFLESILGGFRPSMEQGNLLSRDFQSMADRQPLRKRYNSPKKALKSYSTLRAHAKGLLLLDPGTHSGVYILHSIPRTFAVSAAGKVSAEIPETGSKYGQHVTCWSLSGTQMNSVAKNLNIEQPNIFHTKLTSSAASYSDFQDLAAKKFNKDDQTLKLSLRLPNGDSWKLLTKSRYNSEQLWDDLVLKEYKQNMDCLTWGRPYDPSKCSSPTVENVEQVTDGSNTWKSTQNHAKICVGKSSSSRLVCFGDMNRMDSQRKRGGSAMCSDAQPGLASALRRIIKSVEAC